MVLDSGERDKEELDLRSDFTNRFDFSRVKDGDLLLNLIINKLDLVSTDASYQDYFINEIIDIAKNNTNTGSNLLRLENIFCECGNPYIIINRTTTKKFYVYCLKCGTETPLFDSRVQALVYWLQYHNKNKYV